jgi:hypothetical protein
VGLLPLPALLPAPPSSPTRPRRCRLPDDVNLKSAVYRPSSPVLAGSDLGRPKSVFVDHPGSSSAIYEPSSPILHAANADDDHVWLTAYNHEEDNNDVSITSAFHPTTQEFLPAQFTQFFKKYSSSAPPHRY